MSTGTELTIPRSELLTMLRTMKLIRRFEERSAEHYARGNIGGFLHLYIGEEAVAVGVISPLRDDDKVVTHYRDHGHALARGSGHGGVHGGAVRQVHGLERWQGRFHALL